MAAKSGRGDPVLEALDAVVDALRENARVNQAAVRRARDMARQRARGASWRQILSSEDHPVVVEMLTENLERIQTAGSALRREIARALRDQGATLDEIGAVFGVSRQRVSSLLADPGPRRRPGRPPGAQASAAPARAGRASTSQAGRGSASQATRRASDQSRSRL